jgi:hypothetical protein
MYSESSMNNRTSAEGEREGGNVIFSRWKFMISEFGEEGWRGEVGFNEGKGGEKG